jgi:cytochrome c oxidase cbb3-type subunit 3
MLVTGCDDFDSTQESQVNYQELSGKQAYELVCASCHDEGIDGAPRTYHKDDWLERSWLWEAVIFEHAKEGFLEMPAKGGEMAMDDTTVEKAAEYMLSITFPQIPPSDDQE